MILYSVKWIIILKADGYDYGARFYDPGMGRFPSLDPLSDEFEDLSPYNSTLIFNFPPKPVSIILLKVEIRTSLEARSILEIKALLTFNF